MTLKEAIERYTNNAKYERIHGSLQGCLDFIQLAEWLKDYKRLLEQEPKSGTWEDLHRCWICSECGYETHIEHKFCPNCGARMESEDV